MPDVRAIAARTHAAGALLYVDGVHYTAHHAVDFRELGAEFFACSPYKFLGPHCGVAVGKRDVLAELRPDKLLPAPDRVPERFEHGTLPYELMAGTTAAVDFFAGITDANGTRRDRLVATMSAVAQYEDALRSGSSPAWTSYPRSRSTRAQHAGRRRCSSPLRDATRQPSARRSPSTTSTHLPVRSMPTRHPSASDWVSPAECGLAWRRTTPQTTSTGSWAC